MPDELNAPSHRWYQKQYNISLPNEDFSRDFIYASGISKIDAWIDLLAGRDYSVLGFEPLFVADFDDENYRVQGASTPVFSDAITHTRASTATYVDADGVLQTAATNVPRVGHHVWNGSAWVNEGLLHESEARTNVLPYSEDFANAEWEKADSVLAAGIVAPDGTTNSKKLIANTQNVEHRIEDNLTPATGTFTDSVFVKAGELKNLVIRPVHVGATEGPTQQATFDLIVKSTSGVSENCVAQIQDFGNGWLRCSFTFSISGTITGSYQFRLQVTDNANNFVFVGDNTSGLYLFGAQREVGPTPSSYIPTAGVAQTRAADVLTIPAANLPWPAPEYIGPELVTNGTFDTDTTRWYIHGSTTATVSSGQVTVAGDGGFDERIEQQIPTKIGTAYRVTGDFIGGTSSGRITARDFGGAYTTRGTQLLNSAGQFDFTFVAASESTLLQLFQNGGAAGSAIYDNISVREINPLAVSIQMDGRVTYADTNNNNEVLFVRWLNDLDNRVQHFLNTNSSLNPLIFFQESINVADQVDFNNAYSPDILVPFNISGRHGSTFVNGAADGVALTANTTPTALPDLSATDLNLGSKYNGTIRTFRIWSQDITDAGLVEATT